MLLAVFSRLFCQRLPLVFLLVYEALLPFMYYQLNSLFSIGLISLFVCFVT